MADCDYRLFQPSSQNCGRRAEPPGSGLWWRPLGLRDVQRLARHQAAMDQEYSDNRVELEGSAGEPQATRDLVEDPTLRDAVGHASVNAERGGNGGALEIAGLARGVVRDVSSRDIEARQTHEAAEHKEGQEDVVQHGAQAEAEGNAGWRQTKRDLAGTVSVHGSGGTC